MASRKRSRSQRSPAQRDISRTDSRTDEGGRSSESGAPTVGGASAHASEEAAAAAVAQKLEAVEAVAAQFPFNAAKPSEFSDSAATGASAQPTDPAVSSSTLTERNASPKAGSGAPPQGFNPAAASLNRVRVDSGGRELTTNQGVKVGDNQNSLKSGRRGPALLEDFILREKITHFDHERIPERVVHARGSGAHGYFECLRPLGDLTRASLFAEVGKRTPVFVRFSTVAGERGSTDTARDVRGFAVKFYTDEGNWDLVGNNIPVFFIQDAMKFPDVIHAVKPEPHNGMPQAASAHDTFWDFVSLMPESTHMLMWVMSDRAIPRSYRMMQGFGVHTFRLVNAAGESRLVKFHWNPLAGTHSLVWDEAVKISGADPDFHRRDLWEAIEAGAYPQWELGVQVFTEEQADSFGFDVLDPTKLIPEELIPVMPVGRMVLNRNPDNFFAETEQVAFCTAHIVPGLDFSNDPLLAGRIHSYVDTQITRLGGPNFHEIPINAPLAQVHNNQRDGMHRQGIARGRVAYEPNSLGGGCPFQAGLEGFRSFAQPVEGDKLRAKPELFAEHYQQATLFWNSQSAVEKAHIVKAFRFELSKVQVVAVRERVVAQLLNVAEDLARAVADGLGLRTLPAPLPKLLERPRKPKIERSGALSLMSRPGNEGISTRRIAILVTEGSSAAALEQARSTLAEQGAVPRIIGAKLGPLEQSNGLEVQVSIEILPSVLWDGLIVLESELVSLADNGQAIEFLKDQYRHCKPILSVGSEHSLLEKSGIDTIATTDGTADPALIACDVSDIRAGLASFVEALSRHRNFARETDPPRL